MVEDRIIKIAMVEVLTGRSRSSIRRDEKSAGFPGRVKIGKNSCGWRLSEVMQWINSREKM